MTPEPLPRLKLSRLRDIGWALWDPIGLISTQGPFSGHWSDAANQRIAGEYDSSLIAAASQLRDGAPPSAVAKSLVQIETELMGLQGDPAAQFRAEAVVAAILADPEIWTWQGSQGRIA